MTLSKTPFIALIILFNAVPLHAVFYWGWQSFDLIFLYWLENLIIGLFTVFRFLVRRYRHPVEAVFPLMLAPFFTFHYGMFCYGHGSFIISLFGKGLPAGLGELGIPEIILPVIEGRHLLWPVLALFCYQLLDWVRDTTTRGLGSDNIKDLMIAPYRRIMVLHITIIASGFALAALNEPMVGLFILIVLKTGFDIYHWNKDEKNAGKDAAPGIDDHIKKKVDAFLDNPTIIADGTENRFNSFEELQASKHYALLQAMARMTGGDEQLKSIETYVKQRLHDRRYGRGAEE